jgi:phosphoglycerol transferase
MNVTLTSLLSFLLFSISIYFYKKAFKGMAARIFYTLCFLLCVASYFFYVLIHYFTGEGITKAVFYHIRFGLGEAGFTEYSKFIFLIAVCFFITLGLGWLAFLERPKGKYEARHYFFASILFIFLSLAYNPTTQALYKSYFHNQKDSDFFKYYKWPSIERTGEPKNLVFIYAESMEDTYFDKSSFPGLIKGLAELKQESVYFTNIRQLPGTEWTMGGMVASQCGIPLISPSHGNSMSGMDKFLPLAKGLGNLLHKEGYYLSYYGGAHLSFAGKGKFLKQQEFDNISGFEQLLPSIDDKSYVSGWGLFDDSLLGMAFEHFMAMSEKHEKFAFFVLTLDTHGYYGHVSKSCVELNFKKEERSILEAVACADYLISDFIRKIQASPYADNTVVVVASDHLAMNNSVYQSLNKHDRRNLFMIIEPGHNRPVKIDRLGSTLDIGPTILSFIGYKGEMGLGRNLLCSSVSEKEIEYMHANLDRWDGILSDFWDFPQIRKKIKVSVSDKTVTIDDRVFSIPVLIELADDLKATLKFEFYSDWTNKLLADHFLDMKHGKGFLLINKIKNNSKKPGFSLTAGRGVSRYYTTIEIEDTLVLAKSQIIELIDRFSEQNFQVHRVAHAGGQFEGNLYTNSINALNHNIKQGFAYFELDFSFTSDGQLVCMHDWQDSFEKLFDFKSKARPTLEEFEYFTNKKSQFRICTLDNLISWLQRNPTAFIITDAKEDNLRALKIISEKVPDYKKRIIPQIYDPEEYSRAKEMGYEQIIWTLYRNMCSNDEILSWVDSFKGKFAITIPKSKADPVLIKELKKRGVPSYVHTVNTPAEKDYFLDEIGVTEIYTDFLSPEKQLQA